MSGGACQKCVDQANDVLDYVGGLPSAFPTATPEALRAFGRGAPPGCGGARRSGKPGRAPAKRGCQKRGPGCADAGCTACADQAVAVIDYVNSLPPAIHVPTMAELRAGRFRGGVRSRGAVRTGGKDAPFDGMGTTTACGGCYDVDKAMADAACGFTGTSGLMLGFCAARWAD